MKYLYESHAKYNLVIPMDSIRIEVQPKGQIIIPKVFRDAYGIKGYRRRLNGESLLKRF